MTTPGFVTPVTIQARSRNIKITRCTMKNTYAYFDRFSRVNIIADAILTASRQIMQNIPSLINEYC